MSTDDELRDFAVEVLQELVEDPEYSRVYENEEIPEEDHEKVFDLVKSAQIWVGWPGSNEAWQIAGKDLD